MNKIKDALDLYKDTSHILATTFFRYIYEDESIDPSDISFVWVGCDTAECWDVYVSISDMYEILGYWYPTKLVKDWYDYVMVSDEVVTVRFFKHLVDTHGYTTPEQLLTDYKKEREENEKRINSPEYKAKEEEYMKRLHKSLFLNLYNYIINATN